MSNVDEYEYRKSCLPQSLYKDMPCTDYQYNYVNDINQSIYTNSSLSLVQYDLTSIYNSSRMTNLSDHFLVVPTIRTCRLTNGNNATGVVQNSQTSFATTSLKNGNQCIIHQADLIIDGKNVVQLQPYHGILAGIEIASKMSRDDLTLHGKIKGFGQTLDNPNSTEFSGPLTNGGAYVPRNVAIYGSSGPGLSNNKVWGVGGANSGSDLNTGTPFQADAGPQNYFVVNGNLQEKLAWNVNTMGQANNIFGSNNAGTQQYLMPVNNLNQDFTSYSYYNTTTNTYVWVDYLTIKLSDVLGPMDAIGYMRRFNAILRIYINTGLVSVSATVANTNYYDLSFNGPQYSTFTNVCPLVINNIGFATNWTGTVGNFTDITCGFFIGSSPNYSIQTRGGASVNFAGVASSITSTRYYYSSILLDPLKASDYLTSQQTKTVISNEYLYNTYTGIQPGSNYSQLIQSGVRNIKAVLILPYIASSLFNYSQWVSPFDPAGGAGCTSPLSIINLQVSIGGVNQLTNTLTYQYENWIEQLSKYNKESSSYGVESSLLDYNFWNYNKTYLLNVNSQIDDNETPRNVVISFVNNSNLPMDIQVFVIYEQEIIVNCSTGAVVVK